MSDNFEYVQCHVCGDENPLGDLCHSGLCWPMHNGKCPACGDRGPKYKKCKRCKPYIPPWFPMTTLHHLFPLKLTV